MNIDITPPEKLQGRFPAYEHTHKYFFSEVKSIFEPFSLNGEIMYRLVWYSFSSCNCGEAAKRVVAEPPKKPEMEGE